MKTFLVLISFGYLSFTHSQTVDVTSISTDTLCNKGFFQVNYQTTGTFNSGNVFYAEISDENGSFVNPIPFTYTSSATSGSVGNTMVLNGLPAGTGYRIRMVSSDPVTVGNDNGTDLVLFYPDVSVSTTAGQLLAMNSGSGVQYQWMDCLFSSITNETAQTFTNGTNGVDYVVQIEESGCVDTSACQTFIQSNSIDELVESITVFPSPTMGEVTVDFGQLTSVESLMLTDVAGNIIQRFEYVQQPTFSFQIESEPGIYFLTISRSSQQKFTLRLLKE